MDINLCSQERIDDALLRADVLNDSGRIVCVSSMSGIAGNAGQTNYATSKAGVIGRVQALAGELGERGLAISAVAPGFIETADDRQDADRDPRSGAADEQPRPGRAAGGRGRDDRLAGPAGVGRPQRQRDPRMRPELPGGVMATRRLDSSPRILPLYARAVAPLLPGASRLPWVAGAAREVPDLRADPLAGPHRPRARGAV